MTTTGVEELRQDLYAQANPERAAGEKRYLKSPDPFIGVTVPASERIAREFRRAHPECGVREIREIAACLWRGAMHEEKRLAAQLLGLYIAHLTPDDWPLLEQWIREATSWDLTDEIAPHLIGPIAEQYREMEAHFDTWVGDPNPWVRRTALVSHVLRIRHRTVEPARVRQLCTPLMVDKEYFVQKAVGWVLRECAVIDPEGTIAFLIPWVGRTPRATLREAVRKLDPAQKDRVLRCT